MVFESKQVISLVTWMAIFLFETYSMTRSDIEWYREKRSNRLPSYLNLNEMFFTGLWFILKGCLIASHFFYFEYAADFGYWTFLAVAITTLINIVLIKTWPAIFFGMREDGELLAFAVSTLIFLSSGLVTGFMWASQPVTGAMFWLPSLFYSIYCFMTFFAWCINLSWVYPRLRSVKKRLLRSTKSKHHMYRRMEDVDAPIDHKPMV